MNDDTALALAKRRAFIDQEVERLQRELAALEEEREEIAVAERVYKRITATPSVGGALKHGAPKSAPEVSNGALVPPAEESEGVSSGPTLPEMVFTILDEAKAEGRKGVDSSEMLRVIQDRWKPNFTADQVRPTLWRLVKKQKKLRKRGRLYSRVEDADASSPSLDLVRH
jgi:hypothetical protein